MNNSIWKLGRRNSRSNFKMALRKQPDRRVKKKRKLEMQENLEITERKQKLADSRNFDLVENLLCYYGMKLPEITDFGRLQQFQNRNY